VPRECRRSQIGGDVRHARVSEIFRTTAAPMLRSRSRTHESPRAKIRRRNPSASTPSDRPLRSRSASSFIRQTKMPSIHIRRTPKSWPTGLAIPSAAMSGAHAVNAVRTAPARIHRARHSASIPTVGPPATSTFFVRQNWSPPTYCQSRRHQKSAGRLNQVHTPSNRPTHTS